MGVEDQSLGSAEQAIAVLRDERAKTLRTLLSIPDDACATRVEWWGRKQTINQRLRAFTGHADDHFQHLHRLLQARGHQFTEAQLLMMKAHSALAFFEVLVLSLDDEDFDATGPNDGDWSARQVLEHVINNEREYRENILAGLAALAAEPEEPSIAEEAGASA
jgi:hypothetical protein